MPTCKFKRKTLSHVLFHVFCLHFLGKYHYYLLWIGFEIVRAQFLSAAVVLLEFTSSVRLHLGQLFACRIWYLTFSWVQLLSSKLAFFVSSNITITRTSSYKNLIVFHHGDNNFLSWYLYQIYAFSNNLNDEGMRTSHLMCVTFWHL